MQIFICSNCGLTANGIHNTVTHEYGHAIGLAHIDSTQPNPCSDPVMEQNPDSMNPCWHDRDALIWSLYNQHRERP